MQHVISQERTSAHQTTKLTRVLLACGVVAGPLFTVVGLTQAFTRPGFDLTRHALSLLENGDFGWIQISSLGTKHMWVELSVCLSRGIDTWFRGAVPRLSLSARPVDRFPDAALVEATEH